MLKHNLPTGRRHLARREYTAGSTTFHHEYTGRGVAIPLLRRAPPPANREAANKPPVDAGHAQISPRCIHRGLNGWGRIDWGVYASSV